MYSQTIELIRSDWERLESRKSFMNRGLWAVVGFRISQALEGKVGSLLFGRLVCRFLDTAIQISTSVDIGRRAKIGPGLLLPHAGPIVIHSGSRIGAGATILQGVTVGNREPDGPVPVVGSNVQIGAYAQILGGVRVGDGARIAALCVVTGDVPAGGVARGSKAGIYGPPSD